MEKNSKHTAVDWLYRWFNDNFDATVEEAHKAYEHAKKIEEEIIAKAWEDGNYNYFYSKENGVDFEHGLQYYNEKYKINAEH
jgi:hypothetical protein